MDNAELSAMRDCMVTQVINSGRPVSDAVVRAMRSVPRHVFLPELEPEQAYRNEAIVTRRSAEGQPTSSSSQPTIMAYMLDQLDVARVSGSWRSAPAPGTTRRCSSNWWAPRAPW